jgi:hypothetical protein
MRPTIRAVRIVSLIMFAGSWSETNLTNIGDFTARGHYFHCFLPSFKLPDFTEKSEVMGSRNKDERRLYPSRPFTVM